MVRLAQILLIIMPLVSFSQVDTVARLYTFGGANNDNAEEIKATADGGYIVVGSTSSSSWGNTDVYLLKVDSNCTYEWSKALGGPNNDWGYSIEVTHDKGFIIAATSNSYGNGGYDAVLMKRDSLGDYQWKKTIGGNDWDFVYDVVQTYDSGYVFCGETYNNTNGFSDVWVVKTDINGDTLWTKTIGGALIDRGNAIIETSDSNIVIAGITNTVSDSTQAYVLKFTDTGTLLWDSIYGDTLYENLNGIIETQNGNYVVNGSTTSYNSNDDLDFYLLRIDPSGSIVWEKFFGSVGDEEAYDLFEKPNGDLFNAGYTKASGAGLKDAILFRINSSGGWGSLGPTYGHTNKEAFYSVTQGMNGDICLAGFTQSFGNGIKDAFLVRLDTIILGADTVNTNYQDLIPLTVVTNTIQNHDEFMVYPTPAKNIIYLDYTGMEEITELYYNITTTLGQICISGKLTSYKNAINVSVLRKGFYLVDVFDKTNTSIYKTKIIIN